jgi:hypothetical protein
MSHPIIVFVRREAELSPPDCIDFDHSFFILFTDADESSRRVGFLVI